MAFSVSRWISFLILQACCQDDRAQQTPYRISGKGPEALAFCSGSQVSLCNLDSVRTSCSYYCQTQALINVESKNQKVQCERTNDNNNRRCHHEDTGK